MDDFEQAMIRLRQRIERTLPGRDVLFTVLECELPRETRDLLAAACAALGFRLELRPHRLGEYQVLIADLYYHEYLAEVS